VSRCPAATWRWGEGHGGCGLAGEAGRLAGAVPGELGAREAAPVGAGLPLRGLIGPGERKSLRPTATGLGLRGHDQLHHSVASTAWDDAPLRRLLVERADALVGGPDWPAPIGWSGVNVSA
jgi:hypothetical protein